MKKGFIKLLLIFTFLILPLILSNLNCTKISNQAVISAETSNPFSINTYSTITSPLNVTEYANRTDAGQSISLSYDALSNSTTTGSANAILPPSWQGNEISVNLYNIYENRCWNLNPEFNGPDYAGIDKNISKVFVYDDFPSAAIRIERGEDMIFYMPYAFGTITNATNEFNESMMQDIVLNRTLNWMGISPGVSNILKIDNDDGYTWDNYYDESFTRLGYTVGAGMDVEETIVTSPNFNTVIRDRDLIIWCTGAFYQIENIADSSDIPDLLIQYLDQLTNYKQNVIVSGLYVGYCLDEANANNAPDAAAQDFYNNYLYSNYLDYDAETNLSIGIDGDVIGDNLTTLLDNGGPPQADIILPQYQNADCLLYNWTASEFGNDFNEDWYYRREIHGRGVNDSSALFFLEDEGD
ncbi:MAG TPA: hypothetical protein VMV49_08355, partial [Candidatus Deferrimicrobium sp.]|nr:hypothetical protein [Candidatus Deferrimicrobium sp.]